jgi:hypothetical protein
MKLPFLLLKKITLLLAILTTDFTMRMFLHIKYIVKNIALGTILEDTQNIINPNNEIISYGTNDLDNNSVSLNYSGTTCGLGNGEIILKKINSTQISWSFDYEPQLLIQGECPNYQGIQVYLPKTSGLIFTKQ